MATRRGGERQTSLQASHGAEHEDLPPIDVAPEVITEQNSVTPPPQYSLSVTP